MKKIKRWMSALLALCMLTVALPVPVLAETTGMPAEGAIGVPISEPTAAPTAVATGAAAEEQTDASPQQTDDPEAAVATAVPTPVPTDEVTGTPTPVPTDNATGTPTPVPTDETTGTPTPVPTDEATATPMPVPTDEATGTPAPVPTDETAGTPAPIPTDEATGTPTPVPTDETTGTPAPVPTDEATGTPTPIPTDAAEVKTIASFEAVAPEGLFVPQGTPETDLGLPASLNVQFADGAAGEVAVAWQCAAGYDPNAEAGAQFAFAAVLPQGYTLSGGVSLPEILVTLMPPLANAMLAALASGEGWTYDEATGTLTITGDCSSADIPVIGQAQWIDVAPNVAFTNSASVTLSCKILLYAGEGDGLMTQLINYGTISGAIVYGRTYTLFDNKTGGVISGNSSFIDCIVSNSGLISDGYFSGCTINCSRATITGGDFQESTFNFVSEFSEVTGGTFANFTMDHATRALTITGTADLSSLYPLTLSIQELASITVERGATLTGGTFIDTPPVNIERGGAFTGGVFETFSMDSASQTLTVTGTVDLSSLAPLTVGVNSVKKIVIKDGGNVTGGAFNADTEWEIQEGGLLTGGSFGNFSWDPVNRGLTIIGEMDLDEEGALEPFDIDMDSIASIYIADNGNLIGGTIPAGPNVSVARYGKISNATITIKEGASLDCIGLITGGTFYGDGRVYVHAFGEITGGTFNCNLFLEPHFTASNAYINGGISGYGVYEPSCKFGEGAHFGMHFGGYIQQYVDADGEQRIINYGANVRQALGTPPEGLDWALQAADGQLTLVGESDTMPLLRNGETRTYVLIDPTTFISNLTIEEIPAQTYTGEPITPAVTITNGDGYHLVEDTDYTVEYRDNVNAGTATVTITGKGIYTGSVDVPFQINKAKAPEIIWPTTAGSITYGEMLRDSTLTSADTHGTFAWDRDERYTQPSPGTYTYDVTYMPNSNNYDYTGVTMTRTFSVTVTKKDIADEIFVLIIQRERSYPYTGEPIEPQWEVMYLLSEKYYLTMGEDYTVAYSDNINAGTATATYTGIGDYYTGTRTVQFTIQPQAAALNVLSAERTWSKDMSLNESDLRALFTVNDAGGTALSGDKYTIAVTQNGASVALPIVNAGEYTVKVTLKDTNYSLSNDSFPYTIAKLPFSGMVNMNGYAYGGTVSQPALSGYAGDGTITYYYKAQDAADWTEWTNIGADTLTPGDYEMKAAAAETANCELGETAPVEFTVAPGKLAASIAMQDYTYGGTVFEPKLESTVTGLDVAWFYKGADGEEHPWESITSTTLTAGDYTIIARTQATALYEAAEFTATFTVEKAAAPAIQWPTAQGITYGQAVSEATLSATADAYGTFAWEQPNAILNAGEQTATLVYTPNDTANYDYDGVELEKAIAISVAAKPLTDAAITADAIASQTYTSAEIEPDVAVKDGGKALEKDKDFTVEYADNIDVGEATAAITGKGNYSGSIAVKFQITAQAAALNVLSAERTWSKDMSLDESDLRALFTVNDAGGKALDGGLYTITVTKDGTVANLPIEDAGEYTVKVTLTTGNYALAEDSFTYTIAKLPFTGTVSMAGYVYEGTASQPVLNGYDGDGEVTFLYRAEGGDAWQEWPESITGVSLVPGNYEIKASVAATQNYAGGDTAAASFTISPAKLGVSIEMPDYTYGGTVPAPALTPETSGLTVAWFYKGADGEEHPWENITGTTLTAGGYTIIARVEASALYEAAELTSTFTVNKAAAPEIDWPEVTQGITYGQALSAATLSATEDAYGTFAWQNPDAILSAGEQTATLVYTPRDTANYDYSTAVLTRALTVSVATKPLDDEDIAIDPIPDQTYTGGEITPEIVVKDGDEVLTEGEDYEVSYEENTETGTATVTVTGKGDYEGEAEVTFEIVEKDITGGESLTIDSIPDQTYTGEEIEPEITVKDGDKVLTEGEDYEVSYKDNTDAGTATVTVTGKGNYTGEMQVTFQIVKATAPAIQWPEVTESITYGQTVAEIVLSAMADANGTFAWKCPDYVPDAGAQLIALIYTPSDTANYDYTGVPTICEMRVEVAPKDISGMTADAIPAQTETGKALTPAVTVRDGDTVLTAGADYTVAYANNIKPGTATVTITGIGNYAGTLTTTFTIREAEKDDEDENDESTVETLTPAQQAENLTAGEAVDGIVTDRNGETMPYVPSTGEVTDEETQEVLQRTLVIAAEPLLDENGQPILRDGKPVYEQRNLNLSRSLLDALAERGYTHIRFTLGDAALEWQIAEMTEESYVVRLAPMEADELSQAEKEAIGDAETLTGSYRARITAMLEGEETDVTNAIPSLTVIFDAESVRELTEGETPQLLLVPNDGEPEVQVLTTQYIEATDTEKARYEALLAESGLFVMTLQ